MSLKSFKTKLNPNNNQRTLFAKHAGTARHAYNWGLATCLESLEKKEKLPTAIDLHKRLVAEVKSVHSWYYEVSKCSPQQALRNLATAIKRWSSQRVSEKPRFKRKGYKDSFYLEGSIAINGDRIKLPRIGWVKCYEIMPSIPIKNVTISKRADDWHISFRYEYEVETTPKIRERIGVDVGINALATCSDGTVFPNLKPYRKAKRKLAHLQRAVSRKVKGSANRLKAIKRLARQHRRIANIRLDGLHKLTTWLAQNHGTIVVEGLNVAGMLKNHRLASAIADCGFYEFKRQLFYKAGWYGAEVVEADRFYPSSQLCSNCGYRQKMPLKARVYHCGNCGIKKDRDLNASLNLEYWRTPSSGGIACGGSSQPESIAQRESMKQEGNIKPMYHQLSLFDT
ncbi:MAG: RNA-guided endonuclease TnpB family protein [Coleofasciculaceae cyanobacterium]